MSNMLPRSRMMSSALFKLVGLLGTAMSDVNAPLDLLKIFTKNLNPATKKYTADIINKPMQVHGRRSNDDRNDPQNEMKLTTDV
jgi:hypothetical protein